MTTSAAAVRAYCCLFLVFFGVTRTQRVDEGGGDYASYVDFNNDDKGLESIRQQSGTDMILKCNASFNIHHHKRKVSWEYKACVVNSKRLSCDDYVRNHLNLADVGEMWEKVASRIDKKRHTLGLHLTNISENQSGLYRCTDRGKTVKLYQVEVIDSLRKYAGNPPQLLDLNVTRFPNDQIIIQCKVRSKQPPSILWLKESDESNHDFRYSDKFYKCVDTHVPVHPIPSEMDVYLSKLNMHRATETHNGIYVCVAVTEGGKDFKEAAVKVVARNSEKLSETSEKYASEKRTPVFLLFLIPVGFALIPITVWLCYYRKRRRKSDNINKILVGDNRNDSQLTRPIFSTRNESNQ